MNIRHLVATATIVSAGAVTGLSQGVASAYPYYGHTTSHAYTKTNTLNTNAAIITNNNPQYAGSGDATAVATSEGGWFHHGTTGSNSGNATSGMAQNTSSLNATVGMSNSAATTAAPVTAHPAVHSTQATVTNTNNANMVTVTNNNAQVARSGDAVTTGQNNSGDATTGAAANTSSTTVSVSLSNSATQ